MALDLTKIPILSPCGGTPLERGLDARVDQLLFRSEEKSTNHVHLHLWSCAFLLCVYEILHLSLVIHEYNLIVKMFKFLLLKHLHLGLNRSFYFQLRQV